MYIFFYKIFSMNMKCEEKWINLFYVLCIILGVYIFKNMKFYDRD